MTNGSSQGLFVVVAVVIFGIFVAISYSLFRDTLTPSLASIFQNSIYQTNKNISSSMVTLEDLKTTSNEVAKIIRQTKDELIYSHDGSNYAHNIRLTIDYFKTETTYFFEYDIELLEGVVETIGGHTASFTGKYGNLEAQNFYINGKLVGNSDKGVKFTLEKGVKYNIKIFLDTRTITQEELNRNSGVYIQPNRNYIRLIENPGSIEKTSPPYTVKITNLGLYEL